MLKLGTTLIFLFLGCASDLQAQPDKIAQAEQLYQTAYAHYQHQEYGMARHEVDQSLLLNEMPESWFLSGLLFENEDKPIRAVSAYEAAVKLDPDYREAIFKKALIYLQYGDPQQALKDLSYLIDNFGNFHETRSIMFQIDESGMRQNKILTTHMMEADLYHYRARAYQKLEMDENVLEDLNRAISLEVIPEYFVTRGLYYVSKNQAGPARRDFLHAIQLDSTYHLAWYNLALIDPSITIPAEIMVNQEFSPTLNLLASRAIESGSYLKAKQYLDQAASLSNADALVFLNRGRLLSRMNEYEDAINDFHRAMNLDPGKVEALYLIGNTYYFQKKFERAIAYYNQYLGVETKNGMVWYNGAMCYLELDNVTEACHYLEMADQLGMVQAKNMLASQCTQD